ncbi:MAG: gamma-glutamyltranspeptidase [Acidimicrobiia bacterium]|nr:gamma-glutamyltranspeptidase [Acidimicrobiia bacterium]
MHGLVRGHHDVAVAPHHLATSAAIGVFHAGGNAVDAAIAANAVQGVVAPETCGIGGDLFALVHIPGDPTPYALNSSGWAGSHNTPETVGGTEMPLFGAHSVTIPGCVAGWTTLHERFGRLPFERLLNPARTLAEEGFFVSEEFKGAMERKGDQLLGQPIGAEVMPGGSTPALGSRIRRPSLARSLARIAEHGAAGFYEGRVARQVSAAVGNLITADDLASFEPECVRPLGKEVLGLTAWTIPPNTQGYLTLAALRILEMLEPGDDEAELLHLQVEAYRSVAWERNDLVADPAFAPLPPDDLVADERLAPRAEAISRDRAGTWPAEERPQGGTAYAAYVDRDGMGVSFIQSNFMGLGTTVAAGDAGFLLQNRGGSFTLADAHPNQLAPGKRPLHTLAPTIWTDGGALRGVLGTRGGHQQPQYLMRTAWELFANGASPLQAQASARWRSDAFGPGAPSSLVLESTAGEQVADSLRAKGHAVTTTDPHGSFGPVSMIVVEDGLRSAAADSRVATSGAAAT